MTCSDSAGGYCVRKVRTAIFALASTLLLLFHAEAAKAQDTVVKFDPANTTIDFTLGAMLHTVHGTFRLKSGEIHVDATTGKSSGSIVVDANSGDSDDSGRDKNMHQNVLESPRYPEIVFSPAQISSPGGQSVRDALESKSTTQLQAAGNFRLHGQDHDMTLNLVVDNDGTGRARVTTAFPVPYVKWGLKSPNTFFLRVSDSVDVAIHASAAIISVH
jgi:polyisoprenoid-binding protein YceI